MLDFFTRGGPIMWPLLITSVVALTFIIERSIFWLRKERSRNINLRKEMISSAEKNDYKNAIKIAKDSEDYIANVLCHGLEHATTAPKSAMENEGASKIRGMKKFMPVLDTIITIAPLLGIFGTVLGIIDSFDLLGSAGIEDPKAVTSGISQALITTATGLCIAIFTLVPYNYFLSKTEESVREIERYGTNLEIILQKNGKKDEINREGN